jgi:hypothetical protein
MKNFVDYTSRKCFASARVAPPRLRNITHPRKISFSGLVIQITIVYKTQKVHLFGPNLGFLVETKPRLENRRRQKALFTYHFSRYVYRETNTKYRAIKLICNRVIHESKIICRFLNKKHSLKHRLDLGTSIEKRYGFKSIDDSITN